MDILDLIQGRRSVRRFQDKVVARVLIEKILEAGRWAPSGLNNQPWRFAVITSDNLRKEISGLTHYSGIVIAAPVLIAVFMDNSVSYNRVKDIQAVGACLQNMLLEVHSLGLGAVWLGEILKSGDKISRRLGLQESMELMAVLAIGHPDERPKMTKRKALRELVVFSE